jgi:hypothetical protein
MLRRAKLGLTAIAIFILAGSAAQADQWRVVKIFGDAWIQTGGIQPVSLTPQTQLAPDSTIRTGPNGKVVLTRGQESMIIGAGSAVSLPDEKSPGWTTIRQESGVVTYDVEKRNVRHFEVVTPSIVAVVKGTQFKVTQNRYGSKVTVTEGLVEVNHRGNGESVLVPAGQKAIVDRGRRSKLRVVGPGERAKVMKKAELEVSPGKGNSGSGSSAKANSSASASSNSGKGNSNSGNGNSGNSGSGNGNSGNGNGNSGNSGSGSGNSGSGNSGNGNGNSGNSGSGNSGRGGDPSES